MPNKVTVSDKKIEKNMALIFRNRIQKEAKLFYPYSSLLLTLLRAEFSDSLCYYDLWYYINIAGRLPENSRNRFVDRQSKKTVKKTDQKNRLFIEG